METDRIDRIAERAVRISLADRSKNYGDCADEATQAEGGERLTERERDYVMLGCLVAILAELGETLHVDLPGVCGAVHPGATDMPCRLPRGHKGPCSHSESAAEMTARGVCMMGMHAAKGEGERRVTRDVTVGGMTFPACDQCAAAYEKARA